MKHAPAPNPEAQWFGYEQVAPDEKTAKVRDVFASVAENYDVMNDLMSGGLHRLWKDHLVSKMRPRAGEVILDVAGGTGDIAIRCAKAIQRKVPPQSRLREAQSSRGQITVCDINPAMLRVGKNKAIDQGWLNEIDWVAGNAEKMPVKSESVDLACIVFGLRNVTHIDNALAEFFRVLKPGGRFYCMEFSPSVAKPLKKLYDLYSFSVLPWLGEKVANDRDSYQYLAESIRQFPAPDALKTRMEKVGFEQVHIERLMGGIAVIHSGWKI